MDDCSGAPPVRLIVLPGLDGTGILSRDIADALPSWIDPVVVSYPVDRFLGYDRLAARIAAELPDEGRVAILGESYSGPLAIRITAEFANRVSALVLSSTFARAPVPPWVRALRFLVRPSLAGVVRWRPLVRFVLLNGVPSERVGPVLDAIRAVRLSVVADRLCEVAEVDVRDMLRGLAVPTLVLGGRADRVVPRWATLEMVESIGDCRFVELDAPHLLLYTAPERAASVIAEFLADHGLSTVSKSPA